MRHTPCLIEEFTEHKTITKESISADLEFSLLATYSPELKFGEEHAKTVMEIITNPVIDHITIFPSTSRNICKFRNVFVHAARVTYGKAEFMNALMKKATML